MDYTQLTKWQAKSILPPEHTLRPWGRDWHVLGVNEKLMVAEC